MLLVCSKNGVDSGSAKPETSFERGQAPLDGRADRTVYTENSSPNTSVAMPAMSVTNWWDATWLIILSEGPLPFGNSYHFGADGLELDHYVP